MKLLRKTKGVGAVGNEKEARAPLLSPRPTAQFPPEQLSKALLRKLGG